MIKPPKVPRPVKPPIQPPRTDDQLNDSVGLIHEKLIGRLVIAWSKLESTMGDFIWDLLGVEMRLGRFVTGRMDATAMIKMLRDIAPLRLSENHWHRLSPLIDQTDIVRDDRNLIVHGLWARTKDGTPIVISLRQKPLEADQVVSETFPYTRMRVLIGTIEALRGRILLLMYEIGTLPGKSGTPPPEGSSPPPLPDP
jgi:hypothetical protein